MLGKRPRPTMRRTSSVSLIGAGSVNGDSSPLPEHPKEKLKSSNCAPPSACAPRQVIGFHPKAYIAEELELTAPISPRRVPQSAKSPGGSPRSGLVDLLGRAPWGRKDEGGVGLGIVAALSESQEEVGVVRDDGRQYCGVPPAYNGWRTPGQSHHHTPSPFAPPRASPPIPILNPGGSAFTPDRVPYIQNHPPAYDNPLCHSVKPDSMRPESMFSPDNVLGSQQRGGGGSRPNSTLSTTVTWAKPNSVVLSGITTLLNQQQQQNHHAHADVEMEPQSPQVFHLRHHFAPVAPPPISPGGYSHSFLEECHLCKRHLVGNDIYIYRGDRAFCSPECRLQQITIDERRDKCSSAVMKMGSAVDPRSATQRTRVAGTAAAA